MSDFQSQSETIINTLVNKDKMSREQAVKTWFNSMTYKEILRRNITFISAMRAYTELKMEYRKDPDWMQNNFE